MLHGDVLTIAKGFGVFCGASTVLWAAGWKTGDLMAIAIRERLHEPFEEQDFFTGNDYRYKEKEGHMRHPGRDGVYETADDIVLSAL